MDTKILAFVTAVPLALSGWATANAQEEEQAPPYVTPVDTFACDYNEGKGPADLKQAISRLAPPDLPYAHELAWHDGNGHSHVQAALLGPSITLPIRAGKLRLGTWQQVVAINHDNGPRKRSIEVTIIGVV